MPQVVTLAEIQVALAGTLKDVPESPRSTGSTPREPPLPVSPGKVRGMHAFSLAQRMLIAAL